MAMAMAMNQFEYACARARLTIQPFAILIISLCFVSIAAQESTQSCNYPQRCEYLTIDYPFGIAGTNCGHKNFSIVCEKRLRFGGRRVPLLNTSSGQYQILNISKDHLIINTTDLKAKSCKPSKPANASLFLPEKGSFTISRANVFASVGCYANGTFFSNVTAKENGITVGGSCAAACMKIYEPEYCNGFGCCQTTILENWRKIRFFSSPYADPSPGCVFSTILDPSTFKISPSERGIFGRGVYGFRIQWAFGKKNCSTAKQNGTLVCSENANCTDAEGMEGYLCSCEKGYKGDGFSAGTGCTDIDECADPGLNECVPPPLGRCLNTPGNYSCECVKGQGDGRQTGTRCFEKRSVIVPVLIGVLSSLVASSFVGMLILWLLKKRKRSLQRRNYFHQNGGLLLQQYIASDRGRKKANIFSETELEKATNSFSQDLRIGAGGFGYVYKGILAEGRSVAIKKCKEVDQEQIDQFINEVIILSQIDHRNIIKLLGCCLETRIPLLVYEFVPNGTLCDHLYAKDGKFLSWENRLQIIIQMAEALAYLHSAASVPIVHRDVKSSNILLDGAYTPKLSDFGLSRLMPIDDSHLTTGVKGTFGYLDPQYFQTVQLTDKTDVYSFGVLMVELLTSMKPISLERIKEERNLINLFLLKRQNGVMAELFDHRLAKEGDNLEPMTNVGNLAEACLHSDIDRRPSMKEVVQELLWIQSRTKPAGPHAWTPNAELHELRRDETSVLIPSRERSHHGIKRVKFDESATSAGAVNALMEEDFISGSTNPSTSSRIISFDVASINSLGGR